LLVAGGVEEFGWRGFAQPQLQENHSAGPAAIGIGLVWVAWHLPFFVLFEYEVFELGGFHWYLLESVAFSVILAWLYNQTSGSLLIVMLCHGTHNLSGVVEPAAEPTGVTARLADVAPDIASVLIVVGLFVAFGHDRLTRSSLPPNVLGRPGGN
jgi:membrane protease YdiL (CAAX protease family)